MLSAAAAIKDEVISTEVQTSTFLLQNLVNKEVNFVKKLYKYIQEVSKQSNQVRKIRNTIDSNHSLRNSSNTYVSNPLNAFGLIKRTGYNLRNNLQSVLYRNKFGDLKRQIFNSTITFPGLKDYNETCLNFALLQTTYNLDINELQKGSLMNAEKYEFNNRGSFNISCSEIIYITKLIMDRGWNEKKNEFMKELSIAWRNAEIELCNSRSPDASFLVKYNQAKKWFKFQSLLSRSETSGFNNPIKQSKLLYTEPLTTDGYFKIWDNVTSSFGCLCRNVNSENIQQKITTNHLCKFLHHMNPYLKLGPFLVEEKNKDPNIITIHKFMQSNEIKHFILSGSKDISRSKMGNTLKNQPGGGVLARTSQQGWVGERFYRFPITSSYTGWDGNGSFHLTSEIVDETIPEYPSLSVQNHLIITEKVFYGITKRIELATQLILDRPYASEAYQIANYGMGGQYTPHPDSMGYHTYPQNISQISEKALKYYSLVGDRLATFMVYLSTVEYGGGTVFPLEKIRSSAIAGNAIFWKNMYSDGRTDYFSVHGGCPVLLGSKWIANKWVQYYDNFYTSPCQLEEFERSK